MFKNACLFFLLLHSCLLGNLSAHAHSWTWSNSAGGSRWDDAMCEASDSEGGICVTGYFESASISFGNFVLKNTSMEGTSDIFLVKYDAKGTVIWATSAGGNFEDRANSVAIDKQNNIYITGSFSSGSISFGKITLNNSGPFGSEDIFVAKFNSAGSILWAKNITGDGDDSGKCIKTDSDGNVYLSGSYDGKLTFAHDPSISTENKAVCLLKFDSAGNQLWARFTVGNGDVNGTSISLDLRDNIFLSGSFEGGKLFIGKDTLFNNVEGKSDIFLTKYNSKGAIFWSKSFGGNGNEVASSSIVDNAGRLILTGYYTSDRIDFGNSVLTNSISSKGLVFVAQFDTSGKILWAKSAGGKGFQSSSSISVNDNGSIFIAGNFGSAEVSWGKYLLTNSSTSGTSDIFIINYDSTGNLISAESLGGSADDWARCLAIDKKNNLSLSGYFKSPVVKFSGLQLLNDSDGSANMFLIK